MKYARAGTAAAVFLTFAAFALFAGPSLAQKEAPKEEKPIAVDELMKKLEPKLAEVQKHITFWRKHQNSQDVTGKDEKERKQKRIAFRKESARLLARVTRSLASVDHLLQPLLEAKKDKNKGFSPEHYIAAAQKLLAAEQAGRGVRMTGKGVEVFPKNFGLRIQHGNALLLLANDMGDEDFDDFVEAAEKSFFRARALDKASAKPWFGLYRVQDALGEDEKALEYLDTALEKSGADEEVDRPRIRRGQLLIRLGRIKDAAKQLDTSRARKQELFQACVLASRCYVLLGDANRAKRAFARLEKAEGESLRVLQAKADMLLALGMKSEAQDELLAKLPPKQAKESSEQLHERQSGQAMLCLLKHLGGDLEQARRKLPAILGISFYTMMPSKADPKKRERRNMDQNPSFMLYELRRTEKSAQYWAEEVLATLCQKALKTYESSDSEKFIEVQIFDYDEREELRSSESWDLQLEYLEGYLGSPDFRGALLARALCKQLRGN